MAIYDAALSNIENDTCLCPGLWFDLEISYSGSFLMTLETKMNLARLGKEGEGLGEHGKEW